MLSEANWFAALRDPGISRALGQIHRQPGKDWTVDALADAAGQTRATFAGRFLTLVGETPIAYPIRWRICLAARQLRKRRLSIEQAAFSRTFKRHYGMAPLEFRAIARAA
ncbi:MAG: helix-turn-helix transcriptional regulator [Candidatus Devosia symbiotica]|nr:helix-turn-helix transcriptional regulator [Candidatus Devosia symbiotica]